MNWALLERYGDRMLDGLLTTVELVGLSLLLGGLLAIPIAIARTSRNPLFNGTSFGFIYFFRGTPLIAQVFLVYYGAGQFSEELREWGLWWFFKDAFNCAALTFSLNTAAYQAEILRGGIQAVPFGQVEAAKACGMSPVKIYRRVILPQAARIALRPYGNEVILMLKGSAIASVITVYDLMGTADLAARRTFSFEPYLWAAVMYLMLTETVRRVWDAMEKRLNRHLAPLR